jgi:proton-translocating NADH-quinone oxidoreductase chain N
MDIIILKSFIPESFLSISILFQLIFNVRVINNLKYNFPVIDKEVFYQTIFIIGCLFLLYTNLKIEGFNSNFLFINDESTRVVKILVLLTCLLTFNIVLQTFSLQSLNFFEFFIIFLLSLLSLLLMISSSDLISFYLVIEMQSLCFYILSSFKRDSSFSTEAGLKYFISGAFISGFFLFGCSLLYGCLGTLNFNNLSILLAFPFDTFDSSLQYFLIGGILCITSTLLFKVTCAPFHFWSPDVYEGSPLSSTIVFSIIPKISIFYFFIK